MRRINVSLESKVYIKYLGVLIDQNLSWKYHCDIDSIVTKISKNVGLFAKLRHSVPRPILLNIYNSLIHPYLTYGLAACCHACKTYLNKILNLQKRALRLLHFTDWYNHAISLFLEANVLPITFLYYLALINRTRGLYGRILTEVCTTTKVKILPYRPT